MMMMGINVVRKILVMYGEREDLPVGYEPSHEDKMVWFFFIGEQHFMGNPMYLLEFNDVFIFFFWESK